MNKQDIIEKIVSDEIDREEKEIDQKIEESEIPDLTKEEEDALLEKIQERIKTMEEGCSAKDSTEDPYATLSEEDREALELGRKIQSAHKKGKKKRSVKTYLILAAVLIVVFAIGMTSMGGAERIAKVFKKEVGEREVTKAVKGDDYLVIENEDEEKAYEEIKQVFGIEPVKITNGPGDMKFTTMNLDEELQLVQLLYEYEGKNVLYLINANYSDTTFGIDMDDVLLKKEKLTEERATIELSVYKVQKTKETKCVGQFSYQGLHYVLVGVMGEEEFKDILNYLYFL